jgi:hypothetical protein
MGVVWTVWLIYFLAAVAASVIAISIGWRGQQTAAGERASRSDRLLDMSSPSAAALDNADDATISDVADVVRTTVERLFSTIQRQHVHLDLAAGPGLFIRLRPSLLADLIEEFVSLGLHAAAGGHMLLTAVRSGSRVDITLSDDLPADDVSQRQSQARELAQRIAMYGGTLDIAVRPNLGTTMTLKLMTAIDRPAVPSENEARVLANQTV